MARHTEEYVASKTTPELQDETSVDNAKVFEKDYLVQLDDSSDVPDHVKDQQLRDVLEAALLRGLRPTALPTLEKTEVVDARNVRLIYKVSVVAADEEPTDVSLLMAASEKTSPEKSSKSEKSDKD